MDDPNSQPGHPLRWFLLALVCAGTFMSTLDVSIVNVALPTLTAHFSTDLTTSQWFVLAYNFVITVLLLTFGRLGDIVGRRRLYIWGILTFVAGSLGCALAVSAGMLILSRAVQGIGSAITMSAGPALITQAFPGPERGKGLGLIGTFVALGLLAGPIVGGLLVQYADWRWMFLINVPIGLLLGLLFARRVRGFDEASGERLDVPGAALLGLALAALVVGLTFGGDAGWTSATTIGIFCLSVAAAAAFVAIEMRVRHPLIDLRLFSNREFSIGAFAGWTNYAAIIPVSVFMPFYLEKLLGYAPGQVGMILAAGPLTLAVVAPLAGIMSDRIGSRLLTTFGLVTAGVGLLFLRSLTPSSDWTDVVWRLALTSLGSAIFVIPNSSSILGAVKPGELGVASGTVALVRNLGMLCGVALAGAIITTVQSGFRLPSEGGSSADTTRALGFFYGLRGVLLVSAVLTWTGAFFSSLRVRPGDREAFENTG